MRRWLVLLAMVLAVAAPMMGNLIINPVLSSIRDDLTVGELEAQWIVNSYLVAFAALMLLGGAMADRFGRKRLFIWGALIFAAASAAGGFSETPLQLIGSRTTQGVGAALLVPATLANLTAAFEGRRGGSALGMWAAVSVGALAYGPVAGAYIAQNHSWEWAFLANVPVMLLALLLAAPAVKETRDFALLRRFDLAGVLTGSLGLLILTYGLLESNNRGWTDDVVLAAFGLAALFLLPFLLIEGLRREPITSLKLPGSGSFTALNAVGGLSFLVLLGISLLLPAYLANILGFSPYETARHFLPFATGLLLICLISGGLSSRWGSRGLITVGCLMTAGALALLLRADLASTYRNDLLLPLALLGIGLGLTVAPMTTAVMRSVEPGQAGGASGATNTGRQLGLILGIALWGAVVAATFRNSLFAQLESAGIESEAASSIAASASFTDALLQRGGEAVAEQLATDPVAVDAVVLAAQRSFIEGLHNGLLLAIGFMLLAALIAAIFVRKHPVTAVSVPADPSPTPQAESVVEGNADPAPGVDVSAESPNREKQPAAAAPVTADQDEFVTTLFQLAFKAGSSSVPQNVVEFLRQALRFQDHAGSAFLPVSVPEPIAVGLNGTPDASISTLTGYLLLEQRFGRIDSRVRPEIAASALIGAARSVALWTFPGDGSAAQDELLRGLVEVVMGGMVPDGQGKIDLDTKASEPVPMRP